jgi:hypothetical protein
MTEAEKMDLIENAEQDIRARNTRDILIDLRDFAEDAPADQRAGYAAAIAVIEANYL